MAIYAILLEEPSPKAWEKLKQHSFRYVLNPTSALVRSDDPATLTSDIASSVGIGEGEDVVGLVCEVTSWNGYHHTDLWEWFRKADE